MVRCMGNGVLRCECALRLCLLLERAGVEGEVVLAAWLLLLLKEIGRGLRHDRPLIREVRVAWHHVPLGHAVARIGPSAVGPAEGSVGAEAWRSLGRVPCTRGEHTERLARACAITWSLHVLRKKE